MQTEDNILVKSLARRYNNTNTVFFDESSANLDLNMGEARAIYEIQKLRNVKYH